MFESGLVKADLNSVKRVRAAVDKIIEQAADCEISDFGAILRSGTLPPTPLKQVTFINGIYDTPSHRFFSPILTDLLLEKARGAQ